MKTLLAHGLGWTLLFCGLAAQAQTKEQVRRAFVDLHDDHIKRNCEAAENWLMEHREALKDQLLAELYRTDWQGANAIVNVLIATKSYTPDQRFRQLLLKGLRDNKIGNDLQRGVDWFSENGKPYTDELLSEFDHADLQERDALYTILAKLKTYPHTEAWRQRLVARLSEFDQKSRASAVGEVDMPWIGWRIVDDDFEGYVPLLLPLLKPGNNIWLTWAIAWELKKHGELEKQSTLFTPALLDKAAAQFVSDDVPFNSSQACRLFLLLGDQGLPALRKAALSRDVQTKSFAKALIDALTQGNRNAFEFLNRNATLTITPFYTNVKTPEWLVKRMEKEDSRTTYP